MSVLAATMLRGNCNFQHAFSCGGRLDGAKEDAGPQNQYPTESAQGLRENNKKCASLEPLCVGYGPGLLFS